MYRLGVFASRGVGDQLLCQGDVFWGSNNDAAPLMQFRRDQIQQTAATMGGCSTGDLHDEREGATLVEKAEFAPLRSSIHWIDVDPAFDEVSVKIHNQRADVST